MKKIAIGVDIGGTNSVIGVVDEKGEVLSRGGIPTDKYSDIHLYVNDLSDAIKVAIAEVEGEVEINGIGIGAPNGNHYSGTIEYAPNLKFEGVVPLIDLLKEQFDYPIISLTNDANAAAIGEMIYGGAKWMKNFIMITLGTGLGSGIVINEELVYGHDGFAGELGHLIVEKGGRKCGCGRRGCLETYCSATGIVRTVYELLGDTMEPSVLREQVNKGELTSKSIYDAAVEGDELAVEAFRATAERLGEALANIIVFSSPEAIFLFGGLANSGDILVTPTKKYMEEHLLKIFKDKVSIHISELPGADAAILGASSLVWQELRK